jgi:hypothetical protein
MTEYSVKVMSGDDYRAWREQRPKAEVRALIAETGVTPLRIMGETFYWICPGCGSTLGGDFADQPVSGWEAPRWTRDGDDEHLTLMPSLGCPGWRDGSCPDGHWWLRDGSLVPA